MLSHITLKNLRPKLPQVINRVDHELDRFVISRRGEPVAVLLSIVDYESFIETLNETADKAALIRIRRSLSAARSGKTTDWKAIKGKYGL